MGLFSHHQTTAIVKDAAGVVGCWVYFDETFEMTGDEETVKSVRSVCNTKDA